MEKQKSKISEMMKSTEAQILVIYFIINMLMLALGFKELVFCFFLFLLLFVAEIYYFSIQDKISKHSGEECELDLSNRYLTEVTMLKTPDVPYNDFLTSLETARFFAELDEEKEYVLVFIKFENEDFERELETIDVESFWDFYQIKEDQQEEEND